jgi:Fe-S cluster assembly protein SufD
MNKILVSKNKIESDIDGIICKDNVITFKDSGEYVLEYTESGEYNITFNINKNIKIIESSFDNDLIINNNYIIDNGSLNVVKFYNNQSVNEIINIDLLKDGDKVDYCFANICKYEERYTINMNHKCKKTISNITNKSIAFGKSILKFIINSNVYKDCIKSVLDQNTRIVTMGECDASISPNMFIDLDDVEARHGSVIGAFKEDQVFYLMSKGISYSDTLKLLIKGYILANLSVHFELRKKIIEIIDTYWR